MEKFKLHTLSVFVMLALSINVNAADKFNAEMIKAVGDGGNIDGVDLSYFSNEGGQAPGNYSVDIYLNNEIAEHQTINFTANPDAEGTIFGVLTPGLLKKYGVKVGNYPKFKDLDPDDNLTEPLNNYIADATEKLDLGSGRYYITVPQVGVRNKIRNAVDPSLWDHGIPVFLLNYNYSGSSTDNNDSGNEQSNYLNLRSGVNVGPWRLRNYSTYSKNSNSDETWDSVQTYAQRGYSFLQGGLFTLGEYATPGDVFDSFQFVGAQLASDDNMLPDTLRQYAPIIRGIARSNAQVTIKQNGYTIYQTNVAPGPFAISDLYPSSNGGDMQISIKEADGSVTQYTQATSSVPILQREGRLKYAITAGRYRSGVEGVKEPNLSQLTSIFGLTSNTTIYGGALYADNYQSVVAGLGYDMGRIGAFSLDMTHALSHPENNGNSSGQSYRMMYAKNFDETDTDLQLAGYRYSTKGYYSFDDVQKLNAETDNNADEYNRTHTIRSKLQADINQAITDDISLFLSLSEQSYWDGNGKERTLQTGLNTSFKGVSYGLNYSYTKNPGTNETDRVLAFNMSVPLSNFLPASKAWANYSLSTHKDGATVQQAGISGTLLESNNLSYSILQGYESKGTGNSGSASVDYKAGAGESTLGYNYTQQSRQVNYGLMGGIVVHQNGVTLSQSMGDSVALVKAPGASDIYLQNSSGIRTDWRGYAVVPYAMAYKKNEIALDTTDMGSNVDIDNPSVTVIPDKGAVVLADYKTRVGARALISMTHLKKPIPFGATVTLMDSSSDITGIVGTEGEVYLTGLPEKGRLMAKWGHGASKQCFATYHITNSGSTSEELIKQTSAQCQ